MERTAEATPPETWRSQPQNPKTKSRNKAAYVCRGCGLRLWGKPDAPAACWTCRQPMPRTK